MTELTATVVIESLLRATADDATPIIRRLARNQARVFLDSRAGGAGEGVWRQTALDVAKDCQRVRHSSATPQERDTALRQAATMLRSFADAATPAPAVDAQEEGRPCDTCQGNGEVVTDWERYMHRKPGDTGDEGTKDCPDCNGTGRVDGPNAVDAVPAGEVERRAYLMTGRWELDPEGKAPGIYMDDPEGGDPICLCVVKRVYHPDLLSASLSHGEGRK